MPLGQLLFITLWGVLLANLLFPFPGKAYPLFLILLGFVVVLHLINMLMFMGMFQNQRKATWKDYVKIFVFGVIGWLMVLKPEQKQPTNREEKNP